jgi:hypothetical protein
VSKKYCNASLLLTIIGLFVHELKHWPPPVDQLSEDVEASAKGIY